MSFKFPFAIGALIALVSIGLAMAAVAAESTESGGFASIVVRLLTSVDGSILTGVLLGLAGGVLARAAGYVGWFIGNLLCFLSGHATARQLTAAAFPRPGGSAPWTKKSADAIAHTFGLVTERFVPGERVSARAVGVEHRTTWHRPLAVVVTDRTLVLAPIHLDGSPDGMPTVIPADRLDTVSIRSEHADGTTRRPTNAYDDLIEITTGDGARRRFVLPYGPRERADVGDGTLGGPTTIREWLRSRAATYR